MAIKYVEDNKLNENEKIYLRRRHMYAVLICVDYASIKRKCMCERVGVCVSALLAKKIEITQ